MFIPVYEPTLIGNEKKYVNDCLETGWISSKGKYNDLFATKFAKYIGVEYGTTVGNGTLALHVALLSLGVGIGDEVIVPSLTYVASANAVKHAGAEVVFADSLDDTWQIDPNDIERRITKRTKAIMAVHLYGHPCDMDKIIEIANKNNLYVIEDCAEAIGSEYKGKKVGSFGHISAFSFFGNKTITCGEGGMVVTNDKSLIDKSNHLKNQGVDEQREYWHNIIGYNYRMTNIAAAIGLAQLEQIDFFVNRKIEIGKKYEDKLVGLPLKMQKPIGDVKHTYWMVSMTCDRTKDRDSLRSFLKQKGIETRPTFYPVHTMPMYISNLQAFPVAEKIGLSGINLPSYPKLTDEQIDYICDCIKEYFKV